MCRPLIGVEISKRPMRGGLEFSKGTLNQDFVIAAEKFAEIAQQLFQESPVAGSYGRRHRLRADKLRVKLPPEKHGSPVDSCPDEVSSDSFAWAEPEPKDNDDSPRHVLTSEIFGSSPHDDGW